MHAPVGRGVAREAEAFAALDLGTNNCRLLVGAAARGGFRIVESFSRTVRLGEGLAATGRLSEPAMDRALEALRACAERLARRQPRVVRAIATEACRQAENGPEFLARVREETGLAFRIISPREEAELAVESCVPLLRGGARRVLLFDIGGGSTELAWIRLGGDRPAFLGTLSLPWGVVSLAEHFGKAANTEAGFDAMVETVAERLRPFDEVHRIAQEIRQGGVRLLGTSGTVTTLAAVALGLTRYSRRAVDGAVLGAAQVDQALAEIRVLGPAGLGQHPCIGADRSEFVLPGCAAFAAIRGVWPAPELIVADRGLREGMLMRMIREAHRR
jgi:exopolyphosphatase/guanosine-5'-triphosphate,3'-diphosphate pyrophosphatase